MLQNVAGMYGVIQYIYMHLEFIKLKATKHTKILLPLQNNKKMLYL